MGEMKALTVHQPWASLIALGVKTIETRTWSTAYRGPIAIHAAKKRSEWGLNLGPVWEVIPNPLGYPLLRRKGEPQSEATWLHFGAVVAVAELTDCLPMLGHVPEAYSADALLEITPFGGLMAWPKWDGSIEDHEITNVTDQLPYGDYTPGRYAWMLDNIKPIDPVPARGQQGLWNWDGGTP